MQLVDVVPLVLRHVGLDDYHDTDGSVPPQPPAPLRAWAFPSRAQIDADGRFARELRSIEIDGWKLIEDDRGHVELYDIARDPGEQRDRAEDHPELVERLRAALGSRQVYRNNDPAVDDQLSEDAMERLRSLGYVR